MRFVKTVLFGCVAAAALIAQADYEVEITFANGATRVLDALVVQNGKVILAQENLQVPFAQIKNANFTFDEPLAVKECELLLRRGAYEELADRVGEFLEPVKQVLSIPGNLDVYIQYQMRACFWAQKFDKVRAAAETLQLKDSSYAPLTALYGVLLSLEQGESIESVEREFLKITNPEEVSGAIAEYLRGRLAFEKREYETALQHFSNVLVYHPRETEWVPAATFYEAKVYKKTGYLESADNIVEELKIAYPDGYWSRRIDELD